MPEPTTPQHGHAPRPVVAAAAVTFQNGNLLLIRRGKPPNAGRWSFPGGVVEPGETVREAARRETREETGLEVEILDVADVVDLVGPASEEHPAYHFCAIDFLAIPTSNAEPHPGDDASDARWVPLTQIDQYDLTPAMHAVIERAVEIWGQRETERSSPGFVGPHPPTPSPNTGRGGVGASAGEVTPLPVLGEGPGVRAVAPTGSRVRASAKDLFARASRPDAALSDVGEFPLIERLAEGLRRTETLPSGEQVRLGVGDDAALLEVEGGRQVVATADALVEGIHFRRDWTGPEELGWKTLAVNVSDVAAMGGEPLAALISLALPAETEVAWVEGLYRGLGACAAQYRCALVGGDTVGSPDRIVLHVALLGTVEPDRVRTRSGARPGDRVCVTGTLGNSAAGLALLQAGGAVAEHPEFAPLLRAHRRPSPRLAAARILAAEPGVTAMMDLSDGIASDLRHIVKGSRVGARIHAAELPISPAARAAAALLGADPLKWALRGGEDYELLFTLSPDAFPRVAARVAEVGTTITAVGSITESGYTLVAEDGSETPLSPEAFAHFG